jgi:hypothetical protein
MLIYKLRKHIQFMPAEAPGSLKRNRLQPELRNHVRPSNVNMRRLGPVQRNKEKPIRTRSEDSGHAIANSRTDSRLARVRSIQAAWAAAQPIQNLLYFAGGCKLTGVRFAKPSPYMFDLPAVHCGLLGHMV